MTHQGPSIVFSRAEIPRENEWLTKVFQEELVRVVGAIPGFKWTSLWRDADAKPHYAMLSVYETYEAGQAAWDRLMQSEALYDAFKYLGSPANIQRYYSCWEIGSTAEALDIGEFMSVQSAPASVGGHGILEDWREGARSLGALPGMVGASALMKAENQDELILMMFWHDRISYLGSVTDTSEKATKLYERIG
jgi:hypothetical protein